MCFRLEEIDSGGESGVIGCKLGDVVIYLCGRLFELFDLSVQDVDVAVENRDVVRVFVDFWDVF